MSVRRRLDSSERYDSIALEFVKRINSHSISNISEMLTNDHEFVDSLNSKIKGKENIVEAWKKYFEMFPDYEISVYEVYSHPMMLNQFVLSGMWKGSYKGDKENYQCEGTATWKIRIESTQQVSYWQIYADNSKTLEVIENCNSKKKEEEEEEGEE